MSPDAQIILVKQSYRSKLFIDGIQYYNPVQNSIV